MPHRVTLAAAVLLAAATQPLQPLVPRQHFVAGVGSSWHLRSGSCGGGGRSPGLGLRADPTPYSPDEYYTRRAREEGVPARSYYKLEELDRRLSLFQPGHKVLDLGCWPGSWCLYAARQIGPQGRVLGIDLKAVDFPLPSNVKTRVENAYSFKGNNVPALDIVMSDMAPKTIGMTKVDQDRSTELVELCISIADAKLKTGGTMIAKHFEGAHTRELRNRLNSKYQNCRILRPKATRNQSPEVYLVAIGKLEVNMKVPVTWREPTPKDDRSQKQRIRRSFDGW